METKSRQVCAKNLGCDWEQLIYEDFSAAQSSLPFQRAAQAVHMFTPAPMSCPHTQRKPVELSCNCSFLKQVPVIFFKYFSCFKKLLVSLSHFHCEFVLTLLQQFHKARIISYLQTKHLKKMQVTSPLLGIVSAETKDIFSSFKIKELSKKPQMKARQSALFPKVILNETFKSYLMRYLRYLALPGFCYR